MAFDIAREAKPTIAQGAESGPSFFAGIRGHGTLQVVRDPQGEVLAMHGTWRPDEESADLADLVQAVDDEAEVRFDGRLDDPARPKRTDVVARCTVTSFGDYVFGARRPEGEPAPTLRVFNFRPLDEAEVLGAA